MLAVAITAIPSFWGWIGTILLGPLFLVALYIYRPSATYLRLHSKGIDISTARRKRTINWSDVVGFHIGDIRGDKRIGILYTQEYLSKIRSDSLNEPDSDGDWIRDLYVLPLGKLCETLNSWVVELDS